MAGIPRELAMNGTECMDRLIAGQRENPGMTLDQAFYVSSRVFERDVERIFRQQWILVGHVSRIAGTGQYFLLEIANESIIVIRQSESVVSAFYNVCRHRGSRICLQPEGRRRMLTCPYHSWTYGLDGALKVARTMPEGFDPSQYALTPCQVRVHHGLIFLYLGSGQAPDFDSLYGETVPYLAQQGIAEAKTAARTDYPNAANWKLVVENFIECYHCAAAHPEYTSVHSEEKLKAFGAGPGSGSQEDVDRFQVVQEAWEQRTRESGNFVGILEPEHDAFAMHQAARFPINENGWLSETIDGTAACNRLMGAFQEHDGGQTAVSFNPFSYVLASNDYAVVFRFTPRDPLNTDIELTWLVHPDAEAEKDYEVAHLTRLWHVTTEQDKTITENNQLGVLSSAYRPGPYSSREARNIRFKHWYLDHLGASPGSSGPGSVACSSSPTG